MTPQGLNDLFTPEQLSAFAAMWASDKAAGEAQARQLLSLFARPKENGAAISDLVSRLLVGVLSGEPDLGAWLQAIAAGSFELRPEQKYAMPGVDERPSRFISRGLRNLDNGVSPAQRHLGITDETVRDGLMLVGFGSLLKEFQNLALARVAVGTAWPLAAGVDKHLTNAEHRQLHQFGNDEELQRRLAEAAGEVLRLFLAERFPEGAPEGSRAASHKRELPPHVDLHGYFTRVETAVLRYREALLTRIGVKFDPNPEEKGDKLALADAMLLGSHLEARTTEFTYLKNPDGTPRTSWQYAAEELLRIRQMLPLLMREGAQEELLGAAARARYRYMFEPYLTGKLDRALHKEVHEWVSRGNPPPPDLRPEHAHLFEEEAAYHYFFGERRRLVQWQALGFFPDPPPHDRPDLLPILEGWMKLWSK